MERIRHALRMALLLAGLGAALQPGWAQARPPELPLLPHEVNPGARPHPDYLAEALRLTNLKPDPRFGSVSLRHPAAATLRHLVLPVQTQAFGFAAAFNALVGAELDHALARRQVPANRQFEVVDATGPFARRLDETVVTGLARAHPAAAPVALTVGHDGASKAFLTIELREGPLRRTAHRELPLPERPREALAAMVLLLPGMLDELGFAETAASPAPAAAETACPDSAWALGATPAREGPLLACHAIALGTLLPEFEGSRTMFQPRFTPAKLAWLATAWVEASRWPAGGAVAAAIQDLAWAQMRLEGAVPPERVPVPPADPVVGAIGRLLSASHHSEASPAALVRQDTLRRVEQAAAALPGFTRAIFIERGIAWDGFRRVDLCGLERQLPGAMTSSRCRAAGVSGDTASGTASRAQALLFQEWRLAAAYRDIRHHGSTLDQTDRLAQVLAELPEDIARHPFIRHERFRIEQALSTVEGNFPGYLEWMRTRSASYVQASTDLQRLDAFLAGFSLSRHGWTDHVHIRTDPAIAQRMDDEFRLLSVLDFDRFASARFAAQRRIPGEPAPFLAAGSAREASLQAAALPTVLAAPGALPTSRPVKGLFRWTGGGRDKPPATEAELRAAIERHAQDMRARVALAMRLLKQGRPAAEARRVIDEQPTLTRLDDRLGESHRWALPGHAYFFAGDLPTAAFYLRRVRDLDTGSASDLHARARLRQIDGDLLASLQANADRLQRYPSDYIRRDVAGHLFMTGARDQAWPVLLPRLVMASTFQLWQGVLVGHRLEGTSLPDVVEWAERHGLARAQLRSEDAVAKYLHLHAVVDRLPSATDTALLRRTGAPRVAARWAVSSELARMALGRDVSGFAQVRQQMEEADPTSNAFMQPMFTWVAWHATDGREPELAALRQADLGSSDFETLLSRSMLLALEGQLDDSLASLQAARWEMSGLGLGDHRVELPIPAGYSYALAAWMMFDKTRHEPFRAEALRFARAHQAIFPFASWAYGLEALLESDERPRAQAICRAAHLDPGSYFLRLAREKAGTRAPACQGAPWPAQR